MIIPTDSPEVRTLVKAWLPLDRYTLAALISVGRLIAFGAMLGRGRHPRSLRALWSLSGFAMDALRDAIEQEKERLDRLRHPGRWRE